MKDAEAATMTATTKGRAANLKASAIAIGARPLRKPSADGLATSKRPISSPSR